jgi:hypothetical protein
MNVKGASGHHTGRALFNFEQLATAAHQLFKDTWPKGHSASWRPPQGLKPSFAPDALAHPTQC